MQTTNHTLRPDILCSLQQTLAIKQPSPLAKININWLGLEDKVVDIKRDDLLHPIISGNKWRKLKYTLQYAIHNNIGHIISFGGGFSNHLHALGYCCQQLNIQLTVIVRGDYSSNPSPMLQDLLHWQAHIQYVDKLTYQQRTEAHYLEHLQQQYTGAYIIPEGGSNDSALKGVAEIVQELDEDYDYILAPVASGGTLAGLIQATHNTKTKILGIAVLKGQGYLEELVQELLPQTQPHWSVCHDYHFGGYAKRTEHLNQFCADFYQHTQIQIEPIYSGKLFFALCDLLAQGYFPAKSKILALHTGGLQGSR